ncbi:phosphoribosyltransferase [Lentzea alba]|uniref:phosphoribosyltransferase n=1 Tax=Lentzea alba TaxID=2714351 RepID=UPI0039BFC09F
MRPTDGYVRCSQCNGHVREFGAELADEVVIISMAGRGGQLAHVLAKYKYGERPEMRRQFTDELAYVLATFLAKHKRVLLIDDQWTSGASLQSSAIALKRAGAARVVGLVIGRRVDAEPSGSFDWDVCPLCQQG